MADRRGLLMLVTDYSHRGGIGAYSETIAIALRRVRPALPLHVLTLNLDPAVDALEGAAVRHVPSQRSFALAAVAHAVRHRPAEVVITHLHLIPLGLVVARLAGAKLTVTLHGFEVWLGRRRRLRLLGNQVDRVMAISRPTAEHADRFFYRRVPRRFGPIPLLPPTVDPEQYHPRPEARPAFREAHGFGDDDLVLLTVGRLDASEQGKGHDRVLRALPQLLQTYPTVKYLIAGRGDDQPRLERIVEELGLAEVVTFAGFVDDLADCYAGVDLFVMPSSQEGFGIVYIEALACGLPVVAGGIDGSVEAVLYGEAGFLCDPRSRDSVTRAIGTALERRNSDDPRVDGARLHLRMVEAFGPAAMAERVDAMLSS